MPLLADWGLFQYCVHGLTPPHAPPTLGAVLRVAVESRREERDTVTLRVMGPISALSIKYLAAGGRGKVRGEVACQVLVRFFALGCINHEQEKKREGGWAGSPGA